MKHKLFTCILIAFVSLMVVSVADITVFAEPVTTISAKERCPVCGMFVAKYKPWQAQIKMKDGQTSVFDGIKDMMAYYFEPKKYGGNSSPVDVYVTDYYTQKLIDGKKAFYVTGSDVLGPMGHEFIPFSSLEAAQSFEKDHKGKKIMRFEEINLEEVNKLRTGMKGHKMHKMKKN